MSADKFSATLQAAILDRARAAILALPKDEPILVERGKDVGKLSPDSPLDLDRIRKDTNLGSAGYEALFTRAGLNKLGQEFSTLTDNVELSQKAYATLTSDTIFDEFKNYLINGITNTKTSTTPEFRYLAGVVGKANIKVGSDRVDKDNDFIALTNINHKDLNKRFKAFLLDSTSDKELVEYIDKNVDAGHLTGVFNIKFQRAFGLVVSQGDIGNYRDITVNSGAISDDAKAMGEAFTKILKLLSDADYLSSNIVNDIKLFSFSTKKAYANKGKNASVTTELQLSVNNQKAGRLLSSVGLQLNNIIASVDRKKTRIDKLAGNNAVTKMFASLQKVADYVEELGKTYQNQQLNPEITKTIQNILTDTATVQKLIQTEGSDSIVKSIEKTIAAKIAGKAIPAEQITTSKKVVNINKKTTSNTKAKTKVIAPKKINIPKPSRARLVDQIASLASLELVLKERLVPQVIKNMGKGSSTNVLNYQTGRFANSARIERLTQSKEGMISVFYSYMRNPYGTFSEGGKQENPKSRDPKLLISKSIREIGASVAYNRMRAVLV